MRLFVFTLILSLLVSFTIESKRYVYEYFPSGETKAKGWKMNSLKIDYWKFYYKNGKIASKGNYINNKKNGYWYFYSYEGNLLKEGHYIKNEPTKWWKFYNERNNSYEECLYKKDGITRYCLYYSNEKLTKARKYQNDVFLQEWTSISSFKSDNPHFKF